MKQTQWDSWYWSYHKAAKRLGCQPLPQTNQKLHRVYDQFCKGERVDAARMLHRIVPRLVARPQGHMNHPLVDHFVFTGEETNPYRCMICATKKQRGQATKHAPLGVGEHDDRPRPGCCRKCGMDYMR